MRLAVVALIIAVVAIAGRSDAMRRDLPAPTIVVLYVGADDCAPCRAWQAGDGALFRSSEYFTQVSYREVKAPHLATLLNDENWPEDVRSYRSRLRHGDGVPLWFVVAGEQVVQQQSGHSQWREAVLPTIRSLLRP